MGKNGCYIVPTAASPGFISGEVGISAALDAFSTVYELQLTRKGINRQTDRQTDMNDRCTLLYALCPREVIKPQPLLLYTTMTPG